MALEDRNSEHQREVVDKFIDPAASVAMTTRDYVVRPSATSAPMTIVLPPVAEAKGRFYSIVVRAASLAFAITITHKDDSECWQDIILSAACDHVLLYSDGLFWHALGGASTDFDYPRGDY